MALDLTYSGGGNPCAEISAMICQIEATGGGTLTIVGEHVVDGSIDETVTNLTIAFGETGKLILGDGLSVPVLALRPAVPYTGTLRLFSPRIDCSRGVFAGGRLSSSAICPSLYARMEIYDPDLYAGDDWRDGHGDSGISPMGIVSGLIEGGCIEGFSDLAIYVTGGLTPAPHAEEMLIRSVTIKNCRQGIDSKRAYKQVTARNVKMIDVEMPYRMSWVGLGGGGPILPPGIRMDVCNGEIRDPKIAFQPEGPGFLKVDGTKVINARSALARNQGGTLKGNCKVPAGGSTKIVSENLTADGRTYKPVTNLKVTT